MIINNECETCEYNDITEISAEEMQRMADEKILTDASIGHLDVPAVEMQTDKMIHLIIYF